MFLQGNDIKSYSRGNALVQNRLNSLPCTLKDFQSKVVQSNGWLSLVRLAEQSCTSLARLVDVKYVDK